MITRFKSRLRSDRPAKLTEAEHEAIVSGYFKEYVDSDDRGRFYILKHPFKSFGALSTLCRLPCLYVCPSSAGGEGIIIRENLSQHSPLVRVFGFVMSVLKLPHEPGQYSLGASKQTLRRKVRKAKKLGISWAKVSDLQERLELLKLADDQERIHPDARYRYPNPDNSDLLSFELWLAAYSAEGRPLLLSVTPVDGDFALLRYFRTLGVGEEESNARYLMTEVLAEQLVSLRVRYLLDCVFPAWLPNGLRHFQRMLGFRLVRIRIASRPQGNYHS